MDNLKVLEFIKKLKNERFGALTIVDSLEDKRYDLVLITRDCADDENIIKLLAKWRKLHEFWFASIFPVSEERTKVWLKEKVINEPERLLFLLRHQNRYIGHIGLFRFDFGRSVCEIDNIVRGEGDLPGVMQAAISVMMRWGRQNLGLKGFELTTVSDNVKALNLYKKLGFIELKRNPMVWVAGNGGGEWVDAPIDFGGDIKRYNIKMVLAENEN